MSTIESPAPTPPTISVTLEQDDDHEQMTVETSDTSTAIGLEANVESFNMFYDKYTSVFQLADNCLAKLDSGDKKTIDETISMFPNICDTIVEGLKLLGSIHPGVYAVASAFAFVMEMDHKRRQNNKKVVALKVQILDTTMILFELRRMKNLTQANDEGNTVENRLRNHLEEMVRDITRAGSLCQTYQNDKWLARAFKAPKYEGLLADYSKRFAHHRSELELVLTVRNARGVDAANEKLDVILRLLPKLSSPNEKKAQEFLNQHTPERCLQDDELLKQLIDISGEPMSAIAPHVTGKNSANDLAMVKKLLSREIKEDLTRALKENFETFGQKIDMQTQNIISEMHSFWEANSWKGRSVKARHFILALQDHYGDKLGKKKPASRRPPSRPQSPAFKETASSDDWALRTDDEWALKHINVLHVQPMLETIDDDSTGFISVKEVNMFTNAKPATWSLQTWIAYWAAGWHVSLSQYQKKIHAVIGAMYQVIDFDVAAKSTENSILCSNRAEIDEYLTCNVFYRIDLLLRSLTMSGTNTDARLQYIVDTYARSEETRLRQNLERLKYVIDTPNTVSIITGPGRIERFILPLIYLLLKRHLDVLYLAKAHVLDLDELWDLSKSLEKVFAALDERIERLGAIIQQTGADVTNRFETLSFGLLRLTYGSPKEGPWVPTTSSLPRTMLNEDADSQGKTDEGIADIPLSILKYDVRRSLESEESLYSSYFEQIGEMKKGRFLELFLRWWINEKGFSPYDPLTEDEEKELRWFRDTCPVDSDLYSSLLPLMFDTEYTSHLGYVCDSCDRMIIQSRFICLTCTVSETYDLCMMCRDIDKTMHPDDTSHSPSHSMLRVNNVILQSDLAWSLPRARAKASRAKAVFRSKERPIVKTDDTERTGSVEDDLPEEQYEVKTLCCCCEQEVNTPCWVCLCCDWNTAYICDDCERSRHNVPPEGPSPEHKHKHHLIRIHDSKEIEKPETPTLQNQLEVVELKLQNFKDLIHAMVDRRFSALEDMVQQCLSRLNTNDHIGGVEE